MSVIKEWLEQKMNFSVLGKLLPTIKAKACLLRKYFSRLLKQNIKGEKNKHKQEVWMRKPMFFKVNKVNNIPILRFHGFSASYLLSKSGMSPLLCIHTFNHISVRRTSNTGFKLRLTDTDTSKCWHSCTEYLTADIILLLRNVFTKSKCKMMMHPAKLPTISRCRY